MTALAILGASPLLYWLRFDFNPMNLRNPNVESVATYMELEKDQERRLQQHRGAGAVAGGGR